jgi:hypothetical protein
VQCQAARHHQDKSSALWSLIEPDDWCLPSLLTDLTGESNLLACAQNRRARDCFDAVEWCLNRLVRALVMESLLPAFYMCDPHGSRGRQDIRQAPSFGDQRRNAPVLGRLR